ncbi:MAG: 5-formyltetrahydrofolate cyclo-ligase, partial [Chthoniobacterales bacterium]
AESPRAEPGKEDLLILPGRAFTRDGHRLGRGGGHYDRYLGNLKEQSTTIGVCFGCQVREKLSVEEHDVVLRMVLWEGR